MYLTGKLEIDPSQSTLIKRVKAENFFQKLLDALSFGSVSKRQEQETFTAVSILQQIYMGLKSIHIHNIIRLAVDDYDFYLDESGEDDDLEKAMFEFTAKVDPIESELFNSIFLVLEHIKDSIKYLIEIKITRKHKVGEYPITINVNGVFPEFRMNEYESKEDLISKMKPLFVNQETYNNFITTRKNAFNYFIDEMELAAKKFIKVDDVKKFTEPQIIRSRDTIKDVDAIRHDRFANPVYYGYYGFDVNFFYAWLWADLMYANNIYTSNVYLVDDLGREILQVGDNGFYAGTSNTLNTAAPFEGPEEGDIQYYPDNEFKEELEDAELIGEDIEDESLGSDSADDIDISD